jgi:DNA-binding winged helix-turn-helix (wHTH) protein/uncharacterized protein YkvS
MSTNSTLYQFGPFLLDPVKYRLVKNGSPLHLKPKAFQTLILFLQSDGRLLYKEEILRTVWADSFVEEACLSQIIFTLRKTLGLLPDGSSYIETVPRLGFRFVASVKTIEQIESILNKDSNPHKNSKNYSFGPLMVLPLKYLSQDLEIKYLSRIISQNIINKMVGLEKLNVIAFNALPDLNSDEDNLYKLIDQFKVKMALLGNIVELKEWLVTHVELIETSSMRQVWSGTYKERRQDLLDLPLQFAHKIAIDLQNGLTLP